MKKLILALFLVCILLPCLVLAEGIGIQSQFGYSGWPYYSPKTNSQCTPSTTDRAYQAYRRYIDSWRAAAEATARPAATPNPAQTPGATTKPTSTPVTDDHYTMVSPTTQEQEALKYLNEDREKNGLSALPMDNALAALARRKSEDMVKNNYFAHTSPTLGSASDMLKAAGYSFTSVGENIARHSSVLKAQAAFMSSTGHRQNILGSQWKKVGIGIAYDASGYPYITQLFVR